MGEFVASYIRQGHFRTYKGGLMDTSETYIKMCEKAEEIQVGRRQPYDGDFYWWSLDEAVHISYTEVHDDYVVHHPETWDYLHGRRIIWLPRQDQLQEMVSANNIHDKFYTLQAFTEFVRLYELDWDTSYEQLWLAFVMKEKYHKTWNGEQWQS